jgi:hypothetical protein
MLRVLRSGVRPLHTQAYFEFDDCLYGQTDAGKTVIKYLRQWLMDEFHDKDCKRREVNRCAAS